MVSYTATILRFDKQGEKTGWTYIEIPEKIAQQLKPGTKKSFKVKGKLDNYAVSQVSLLPMGGGSFIMPLNAAMRKGTGKSKDAQLKVQLQEDKKEYELNKLFMECLDDEPAALQFFKSLTLSHQRYFSKWIDSAKTEQTTANRIAGAVNGLSKKMGYGEVLRSIREDRSLL
ncbi:MAG: YdeI/OmpD-associated family protein [Ferruginibacter sp.]